MDNETRPVNVKMTHAFTQLTPQTAEMWLGHNLGNRNLRRQKVQQYARDMREGNWHISGQAVQFDWNGPLVDGQHRLEAVIESGVTVVCTRVTLPL